MTLEGSVGEFYGYFIAIHTAIMVAWLKCGAGGWIENQDVAVVTCKCFSATRATRTPCFQHSLTHTLTLTCLLNISAVNLGVCKLDVLPNSRPAVNIAQLDNVSL